MKEAVLFEAFITWAEQLDTALLALAILADRDDLDGAHEAQQ